MSYNYLDKTGLALVWEKIKNALTGKVDKVDGKGLSTNDYTSDEKTKLAGIETGAQVNVLEGVQVNGTDITSTNKIANIPVPTKTSDLTNDSNFVSSDSVSTNWVNGSATGSVRTVGSKAEGSGYTIGQDAVVEGMNTQASGDASHAEGRDSSASWPYAHAEGYGSTASKIASHAEGGHTTASADYSHAEGDSTTASGNSSHAEGNNTTARGNSSHAEGYYTTASGYASHTEGGYTMASSSYQHVSGKYNIEDTSGTYAEIIGNGTYQARSNARTLDWNGNEVLTGKLTVGTVGSNSMDVATIGQLPTSTSQLTNDSGFQTATDVSNAIASSLTTVMDYKGTVATVADLPATGNKNGDVYHVTADNGEYAWDGTKWEPIGGVVDLSGYVEDTDMSAITSTEINTICV